MLTHPMCLEPHQDREVQERTREEEYRAEFLRVHQKIMALGEKSDRYIGAWEVCCRLQSEAAFRDALAEVLEKHFEVVVNFKCQPNQQLARAPYCSGAGRVSNISRAF